MLKIQKEVKQNWLECFFKENPGYCVKDIESWRKEVVKVHKKIEKFCGSFKVSTKEEVVVEKDQYKSLIPIEIMAYLENYASAFFKAHPDLTTMCIFDDLILSKHKPSRYILNFMRKHNEAIVPYVEKGIDRILQYPAMFKSSNFNGYVNIFVKPEAFIMLGHYGCDSGSCFGNGGGSGADKYKLATMENTFVALLSDEPIEDPREIHEFQEENLPKSRAWGIVQKNNLYITNIYSNKLSNMTIIKAIHEAVNVDNKLKIHIRNREHIDDSEINEVDMELIDELDRYIYTNSGYFGILCEKEPANLSIKKFKTFEGF